MKSVSYYFDRIRINVYFDRNHLLSRPELRDLNKRKVIDVFEAYERAKERGYHSRIEATAPTNDTFDIIEKAIRDCYKSVPKFAENKSTDDFISISKVEITRDFIFDNEREANFKSDLIMSTIGKKYTSNFFIFDAENDSRIKKKKTDPRLLEEIFSKKTGYWGNKNSFEYVVYARYSKIIKEPSAHTEWRIIGFPNIQKRTGINSISDFKNFDFIKFFEENDEKYLVYETIDYRAIGMWIQGVDGRRTLSKRQNWSAQIVGRHFCYGKRLDLRCKENCREDCQSLGCEIRSAAALKQYLHEKKGKIRNRKKKILGHEKYTFFNRVPITI